MYQSMGESQEEQQVEGRGHCQQAEELAASRSLPEAGRSSGIRHHSEGVIPKLRLRLGQEAPGELLTAGRDGRQAGPRHRSTFIELISVLPPARRYRPQSGAGASSWCS